MIGPTSADPALQVRAIEDLIAQGVKVIGVVPNDAKVLEPVLARPRKAGIIVITHESPSQKGADWDFELASSKGFGEAYGKLLAEKMGGKGEYAVFVGSLTVPLHNAWADAAIAYLKEHNPDMKLVGDRYGVAEDVDKSRSTALGPDLGAPQSHRDFWRSAARDRSVLAVPSKNAARSVKSSCSDRSRPARDRSF
jgi:simple sugar transport system substrate-binding protein